MFVLIVFVKDSDYEKDGYVSAVADDDLDELLDVARTINYDEYEVVIIYDSLKN